MSLPSIELARLEALLATPGQTSLYIKNSGSAELLFVVEGNAFYLQPGNVVNILSLQTADLWQDDQTLVEYVQAGIVTVSATAPVASPSATIVPDLVRFIKRPDTELLGDVLVFTGERWESVPAGPSGYALLSNGPGQIPSYQAVPSALGNTVLSSQVTTGMSPGRVGRVFANKNWTHAQADSSRESALAAGVFTGTSGIITISGELVCEFTTSGGEPVAGQEVFLASEGDDGGDGGGKFSAIPPASGFVVKLGICLDNSDYATNKTCVVLFNASSPVSL